VYGFSGQSWSTANVVANNWTSATRSGFYLNFAYIEGNNNHATKIPMTAPVATRNPGGDEKNWLVSFFTPASIYSSIAEVPVPTDANVNIEAFPLSTFAVVEFGGEADEFDYKVASNLLKDALKQDGVTLAPISDPWAEVWCGYDAPDDIFNRHNEAWVKIVLQ
jgi:SOUL heme-binding protein